jgi:hypothetical protein
MRPSVLVFVFAPFVLICYFSACRSHTTDPADSDSGAGKKSHLLPFKRNPETRAPVRKEPVAEYRVRTDDSLNESWFSVRLYETSKTMRYRIEMEFQGLTGTDTLKLPDLGRPPQPAIEKGKEKYACILGLLDNDHKFREMKMVYVTPKEQSLKITTLKHYVVTENYRLVGQ